MKNMHSKSSSARPADALTKYIKGDSSIEAQRRSEKGIIHTARWASRTASPSFEKTSNKRVSPLSVSPRPFINKIFIESQLCARRSSPSPTRSHSRVWLSFFTTIHSLPAPFDSRFPRGKKRADGQATQASLGPSIRDDLVPNIRLRASPRRSVTQTSLFHCSFSEWAARTSRRYISAASFMLCIVFEFRASSLLLLHQPAACARFIARYCLLALRANCRKVFEDIGIGSGYWRWMYHRYRYADRR